MPPYGRHVSGCRILRRVWRIRWPGGHHTLCGGLVGHRSATLDFGGDVAAKPLSPQCGDGHSLRLCVSPIVATMFRRHFVLYFPPGEIQYLVAAEIGTSQRNWLCAPPQPIRWAGLLLPLATRAATPKCRRPAQPVAGATGAAECYAATIRIVDPTLLGHNTMWRRNTNSFFLSLMVLRPSKGKKEFRRTYSF
jgi:hypothetical protein